MAAPSSMLWSTARYATSSLTGDEYAVGDSLYIHDTTLKLTNNVANDCGLGAVAVVVEEPDLDEDDDRMVLRCTLTDDDAQEGLFALLSASEL